MIFVPITVRYQGSFSIRKVRFSVLRLVLSGMKMLAFKSCHNTHNVLPIVLWQMMNLCLKIILIIAENVITHSCSKFLNTANTNVLKFVSYKMDHHLFIVPLNFHKYTILIIDIHAFRTAFRYTKVHYILNWLDNKSDICAQLEKCVFTHSFCFKMEANYIV